MPDDDDHISRQLASPAGQALVRMADDPDFADAVVADAAGALAGYDLGDAELAALAADAPLLVPPEVQGLDRSGGASRLRTPALLGLAGLDLGSGRLTGISGGDLGSGRVRDISSGDLGSGR